MSTQIKKKKVTRGSIYMKNILTRQISLAFQSIGSNIKKTIKRTLENDLYGRCTKEGYIKKESINIISFSSGIINGNNVIFIVVFECLICHPVEGQIIKCKVQNITRAGIRALYKEENSPITVFVARDHHFNDEYFSKIKEDHEISIKVIGIRYELYDETIAVLGELKRTKRKKTKVIIEE